MSTEKGKQGTGEKDYRGTVFLPQTDFPMKAQLPQREPAMLERWQDMDIYARMRETAAGRPTFILHDGPPYANGHMHIGHAVNRILKDLVNRTQYMLGHDVPYVPGWDCHGLPIEWQIEEQYRKAGKNKDEVPILEFRQECRDFAAHWLNVQRSEIKRLGVIGYWDNPYTTMAFEAEAGIAGELLKFLMNGGLYKGAKPVMWSVVEKTALAEAEVEYKDHTSTQVDVRFPIVECDHPELEDASVVIWTTTPWTLPGNRAICFGPEMDYSLIQVTDTAEGSLAMVGEKLLLADALLADTLKRGGITGHTVLRSYKGDALGKLVCAHPWRGQGYDFNVPLIPGDHVTTEAGTGFVHTAPGHGEDDFVVGQKFGIEVPQTVDADGLYLKHVPLFAGHHVFKADDPVCDELRKVGALLARGKLTHSYPHSWRSKAPLIFRTTPQWFISMDTNDLRKTALAEIDRVRWVPAAGRNRIHSMVESRPDWVVSRQRAWGVPITVFVHKETGELLRDEAVNARIVEAFGEEGADAWYTRDVAWYLGHEYNADDWDQVTDTLDVWFDSGSSHAFVLEGRPELHSPADLYLEGSDQHRGWFHSSLLESCGTRGRAPYKAVLTHGFTMDKDGRKMSKSEGNTVAPEKIIQQYGADILRLWVVGSDYVADHRIGDEIIKGHVDAYRKIRNTLRFMLGNLANFSDSEKLDHDQMPELERWMRHRLWQLDKQMRKWAADFDYHRMYTALYHFCTVDLSAVYFDIRKDALYCDAATSTRRRAARTVLDDIFHCLTAWLAPILCFTAEEAWLCRFPGEKSSVHLRTYVDVPTDWQADDLAAKWDQVFELRRVVTGALELERREKRIGASLQAAPHIYVSEDSYRSVLDGIDLAEICITSDADLVFGLVPDGAFTLPDVPGIGVVSALADGEKCQRCWQVLPDVGQNKDHPDVCHRCADAVVEQGA